MNNIIYFLKTLTCVLFLMPFNAYSQKISEAVEKAINDELRNARQGKVLRTSDINFSALDSKAVLIALKKFENDSSAMVRFAVQTIQYKIALSNNDNLIRQEVVTNLVHNCFDIDPSVNQPAATRLLSFRSNEFSTISKKLAGNLLQKGKENSEFVLIIGVAQNSEQINHLKALAGELDYKTGGWYRSPQWYATLALGRMGNNNEIEKVIALVESETDPILRVTRLLRDVAYMRQPSGVKLLQKYLESEESLPADGDDVYSIKCNQYALEFLTQSIDGFPIVNKGLGYSESEIILARNWLKNNPKYKIIK